jgi:hypothetical protein
MTFYMVKRINFSNQFSSIIKQNYLFKINKMASKLLFLGTI